MEAEKEKHSDYVCVHWKYKHCFELRSKSKNASIINLNNCWKPCLPVSQQYSAQWRSLNYWDSNYLNNMGSAKYTSVVHEFPVGAVPILLLSVIVKIASSFAENAAAANLFMILWKASIVSGTSQHCGVKSRSALVLLRLFAQWHRVEVSWSETKSENCCKVVGRLC